jgi:hypothetical protein
MPLDAAARAAAAADARLSASAAARLLRDPGCGTAAERHAAAVVLGGAVTPRKSASSRRNCLRGLAVIHAHDPTSRIMRAIVAGEVLAPVQVEVWTTRHRLGPAAASRQRMRRTPTGLRWQYDSRYAGLTEARHAADVILSADPSLTAAVFLDPQGRRCGYTASTPLGNRAKSTGVIQPHLPAEQAVAEATGRTAGAAGWPPPTPPIRKKG